MGIELLLWLIVYAALIGGLAALGVWLIGILGTPQPLANILIAVIVVVAVAIFILYIALPMLPPLPHR